jgi:hypothetical protein
MTINILLNSSRCVLVRQTLTSPLSHQSISWLAKSTQKTFFTTITRVTPHTAKMPEYPGWNMDLRWTDQQMRRGLARPVTYPIGIHYNCFGASSEMLLVREVALMLVMDRLTDKPDWHVKVFDDEIAEKWKTEALAWPDADLWERIAQLDPSDAGRWNPKMPKNILDKECLDHVGENPPGAPPLAPYSCRPSAVYA